MLTKKTRYAFHALIHLAESQVTSQAKALASASAHEAALLRDGIPDPHGAQYVCVAISEISKVKQIPLKFLENILLELKKGGILGSKKGKGGGYYLLRPADQVPLAKVIRILDGPIALLPCVSINYYEPCPTCDEATCGLRHAMCEVRDETLRLLENRTVANIMPLKAQ